ncbi:MAG TPA: type IV pilin N-terminal domain-containing protein [Candidatus Thermoplasmatota archaeon]|nr:type IV pilin N-terminal domain-containing protein [Candidatus Thermoplasmatota archaeon]
MLKSIRDLKGCDIHFWKKNQRKNKAASEVLGTLLLIGIGVSLFVLLAIVTFSLPSVFFSDPIPSVNIVGRIEAGSVVFEHLGGQSLPLDTEITVMFAETPVTMTIGDILDSASKADGEWNIGEKLVIPSNNPNLPIMQISVIITDKASNTVVMRGVLQEGSQDVNPIAVTLNADSITTNTARIYMHYDYRYYIGTKKVCFTYIKASTYLANNSAPWNSTAWIQVFNQNGSYNYNLVGLNENTEYFYQAWVQYNSSTNASQKLTSYGPINLFRTQSYSSGLWHFDENAGLIAIDSSYSGNNGTLFPADESQAAQRLNQTDLVVNGKSLRFDGYNDYVVVNHAASLSPTNEIAIEGWVKPEFKDEYKGTSLQRVNSTMYGTQTYGCYEPDMINISADRFAIVSRNAAYGGFVYTVQISAEGNITENATTSLCDIYQFETVRCETPKIIKVVGSSDIYAIVYRGQNGFLYIATVQILSNGKITKTIQDKKVVDSINCYYPDIIYTDGDYYGVVYSSYEFYLAANRYVGRLQVTKITSAGVITAQKSYYNFGSASTATGIMQYLDIIHVQNDYYSIVFRDSDTDGSLKAAQIKNGFVIFVDNTVYKFDNNNISDLPLRITHVFNKIYAVFYGDKMGTIIRGGVIMTINISDTGTFVDSVDYSTLLPPADWNQFTDYQIIHIAGDIFAASYRISTRAEVKTFQISNLGLITNHTNDAAWKYVYQPASSYTIYTPKIIEVSPVKDTYAIVYPKTISYDTNNGVLLTIKIPDNGSIMKKIYDSVLLGPVNFYAPDITHVSNDVYAVISRKVLYGSMSLHTVQISNIGKIEKSYIDTLDIPMPEITPGLSIKIIYVTNNIYLIVFNNYGNPAITLKTVEIANNGTIKDTILYSYNITKPGYSNFCSPNIIRIKDEIFAISYHSTNYASKSDFISTIQISMTGNITLLDTFTMNAYFSSVYGYDEYSDIIPVDGSNHLYALLYGYDYFIPGQHRGSGVIITIQINDTGSINQNPFATFTFESYGCSRPDFVHIYNTTYALAYSKSVWVSPYQISGSIQTIRISSNGTLIKKLDGVSFTVVNTNYDIAHSQFLDHIYKDVYALIYTVPSGSTAKGYIGTFCIATNGSIYRTVTNAIFDAQLAFKSGANILPSYTNITNNIVAVCYQGDYDDGYIETIKITITDTSATLKNIISKSGSYAIQGNKTVFKATLRTTSGDKTLTMPIHQGWNYLVLTYDHVRIKFFNNLTNVSLLCNENIQSSAAAVIFGGFRGIYDECAIYKTHLQDDEISDHYTQY